jgi:hypothetical protein
VRHIALRGHQPNAAWVQKADLLLKQLKSATDAATRNDIIDKNAGLWGDLKVWLLGHSHGKCWFSEAKEGFSHWDVEHYRPKKCAKALDGTEDDGYWWLAFDWQNFRVCGNAGNRKKGAYFPLRTGCSRVGPGGDLRREQPVLLDPANAHDPTLLFFSLEGRAIAAPGVTDDWEQFRVRYSVERYNLDFPQLMDKRKTVWADCWAAIQEYLRDLGLCKSDPTNEIAREGVKLAANRVRDLIQSDRELSAVARACVESAGDPRVSALLRSA